MPRRKTVTISSKNSIGYDEVYVEFFNCPNCNAATIRNDKYCHYCGIKIEWNLDPEMDDLSEELERFDSKEFILSGKELEGEEKIKTESSIKEVLKCIDEDLT